MKGRREKGKKEGCQEKNKGRKDGRTDIEEGSISRKRRMQNERLSRTGRMKIYHGRDERRKDVQGRDKGRAMKNERKETRGGTQGVTLFLPSFLDNPPSFLSFPFLSFPFLSFPFLSFPFLSFLLLSSINHLANIARNGTFFPSFLPPFLLLALSSFLP
jgi:hypothetical protein